MRVIGIDPSLTSTGISDGERHITIETVPIDAPSPFDIMLRVQSIMDEISTFIGNDIVEFYVEYPALSAHNTTAMNHLFEMGFWLSHFCGTFMDECTIRFIPVATLKKFICGKGNGAKASLPLVVYKKWGIEFDHDAGYDKLHAYAAYRYGVECECERIKYEPIERRGQGKAARTAKARKDRGAASKV